MFAQVANTISCLPLLNAHGNCDISVIGHPHSAPVGGNCPGCKFVGILLPPQRTRQSLSLVSSGDFVFLSHTHTPAASASPASAVRQLHHPAHCAVDRATSNFGQ